MNSQSSTPEIHSIANRKQLEEVYDLLGQIFPVGRDFFQKRMDNDSAYDQATTWAASLDGTIASTVQVFPFHCRIEDAAAVKVGGIGSVATSPEYRGQGLCQNILKQQTAWMAEEEYDLSLLFAVITPFYEKLGWSIVPEPVYEMERSNVAEKQPGNYVIAPFEPNDTKALADIYEQFNRSRTYTVIRSDSYWTDRLSWPVWQASSCLVARKDDEIVAYGQISKTQEGKAHLEELCYKQGDEAAAIPLFQGLLRLRPDAETISAKLPDDHVLLKALPAWGARRLAIDYAMWKVIRFQPLLAKLENVFARRLQHRPELLKTDIRLHLICEQQHAYIHSTDGAVTVEPQPRAGAAYIRATLSQVQFVTLLFQGVDEASQPLEHSELLSALFPRQHSIFYLTDKF